MCVLVMGIYLVGRMCVLVRGIYLVGEECVYLSWVYIWWVKNVCTCNGDIFGG